MPVGFETQKPQCDRYKKGKRDQPARGDASGEGASEDPQDATTGAGEEKDQSQHKKTDRGMHGHGKIMGLTIEFLCPIEITDEGQQTEHPDKKSSHISRGTGAPGTGAAIRAHSGWEVSIKQGKAGEHETYGRIHRHPPVARFTNGITPELLSVKPLINASHRSGNVPGQTNGAGNPDN